MFTSNPGEKTSETSSQNKNAEPAQEALKEKDENNKEVTQNIPIHPSKDEIKKIKKNFPPANLSHSSPPVRKFGKIQHVFGQKNLTNSQEEQRSSPDASRMTSSHGSPGTSRKKTHSLSTISPGSPITRYTQSFVMHDEAEIRKETLESISKYLEQFSWSGNGKSFVGHLIEVAIKSTQKQITIEKIKEEGVKQFNSYQYLLKYLPENELRSILNFILRSSTGTNQEIEIKEKSHTPHPLDNTLRYFCAKPNFLGAFIDKPPYNSRSCINHIEAQMEKNIKFSNEWKKEHDVRLRESNNIVLRLKIDESVKYVLMQLAAIGKYIETKSPEEVIHECIKLKSHIQHFSFRAANDCATVMELLNSPEYEALRKSLSYLNEFNFTEVNSKNSTRKITGCKKIESWYYSANMQYKLIQFVKKEPVTIIGKEIVKHLLWIGTQPLTDLEKQAQAFEYLETQSKKLLDICMAEQNSDSMVEIDTAIQKLFIPKDEEFWLGYIATKGQQSVGAYRETKFYHTFYNVLTEKIDAFEKALKEKTDSTPHLKTDQMQKKPVQHPLVHMIVKLNSPLCDGTRLICMNVSPNITFSELEVQIQTHQIKLSFADAKLRGWDERKRERRNILLSETIQSQCGVHIERNRHVLKLKLYLKSNSSEKSIFSGWVHLSSTPPSSSTSHSLFSPVQSDQQSVDVDRQWSNFSKPFHYYMSQYLELTNVDETKWNTLDVVTQNICLQRFGDYQTIRDHLFGSWLDFSEAYDPISVSISNAESNFRNQVFYIKQELMKLDEILLNRLMTDIKYWASAEPLQQNYNYPSGCLTYLRAVVANNTQDSLRYSDESTLYQLINTTLQACKDELHAQNNAAHPTSSRTTFTTSHT